MAHSAYPWPALQLQYAPVGQTWRDPESLEDVPLVPGMTPVENQLRWGFVQKVGFASRSS